MGGNEVEWAGKPETRSLSFFAFVHVYFPFAFLFFISFILSFSLSFLLLLFPPSFFTSVSSFLLLSFPHIILYYLFLPQCCESFKLNHDSIAQFRSCLVHNFMNFFSGVTEELHLSLSQYRCPVSDGAILISLGN